MQLRDHKVTRTRALTFNVSLSVLQPASADTHAQRGAVWFKGFPGKGGGGAVLLHGTTETLILRGLASKRDNDVEPRCDGV